jgi:hypothetical protein
MTYPVHDIEDQSHSDTKFLKVQLTVSVEICQIPDFLELIIAKPTVPEHGGGLGVVQAGLAACE